MRSAVSVLIAAIAAATWAVGVSAQAPSVDLANATLEELMSLRVTSAARKSQRTEDVPAAIYVITSGDIRRSGLTSLPEILRLAPGVQVAQVSSSKWAVSIRGFNSPYSNKLLVLIDGRSVYSRTFSGVFWDLQDVMVSDIDRIEVIRGPGGVAWGANAVNGVISVITRAATEQQGLDLRVSGGTFVRAGLGVRYGGTAGSAAYRVFSQFSEHADSWTGEQPRFSDKWGSMLSGARIDWARGADAFMGQGHIATSRTRAGWLILPRLEPGLAPSVGNVSRGDESSVLGRWTRTRTSGSVLQVQAYHTRLHRDEPIADVTEATSDVDAQFQSRVGSRHGLVFGGGYRHVDMAIANTVTVQMASNRVETFNTFLQDEISVQEGVALTLGTKLEYDTFGSWGVLPSARVMWEASPVQRLWAAVSRTRRLPANSDRFVQLNLGMQRGEGLPILIATKGSLDFRSERLVQLEMGHRVRVGSTASFETTIFTGSYDDLSTSEPFEPTIELTPEPAHVLAGVALENLLSARVGGVEVNARWNPAPRWEVESSYSRLHVTADPYPASVDVGAANTDGNAPRHQWQARSTVSLRRGLNVGASMWRVGRLRQLDVPGYTRVDAKVEFRVNSRMTAEAIAQNLSNDHHDEFASQAVFLTSRVPRSVRFDLRWEF